MVLDFLIGLVDTFGYVGVFLGSLIGSASILLPVPSFLFVILAGKLLNPFFVGILAGLGAAIGELTAYGVALGILKLKKQRKKKIKKERNLLQSLHKWFKGRWGPVIIFIFAITPLPDDIIGLYCGAIRYDIKKFFIATLIGKVLLGLMLAYAGLYGIDFIINLYTGQ